MSPEENEEVIDLLLKNTNAKIEEIIIPKLICDSGITEYKNKKYNPEIKKAIRIWPHKNNIEGFFICKIKKLE
jgi:ribosomal RNA methyltransferase Nop2